MQRRYPRSSGSNQLVHVHSFSDKTDFAFTKFLVILLTVDLCHSHNRLPTKWVSLMIYSSRSGWANERTCFAPKRLSEWWRWTVKYNGHCGVWNIHHLKKQCAHFSHLCLRGVHTPFTYFTFLWFSGVCLSPGSSALWSHDWSYGQSNQGQAQSCGGLSSGGSGCIGCVGEDQSEWAMYMAKQTPCRTPGGHEHNYYKWNILLTSTSVADFTPQAGIRST